MNRKTFPIILLNLVNGIGFTLLIPVLPFIVRDLGYSAAVFSLLMAAYPISQIFAPPLQRTLNDYYGHKPILLVSQGLYLVGLFSPPSILPLDQFGPSCSLLFLVLSMASPAATNSLPMPT